MPSELIPPAVRVALGDAMGGSGPYTFREIEDKHASFDFKPPASLTRDRALAMTSGADPWNRSFPFESHQAELQKALSATQASLEE